MKQLVFEQRNARAWQSLEATLEELESSKKKDISEAGLKSFVADYKQVCSLYSLAKTRQYSPVLLARLHSLVMRGHHFLYASRSLNPWYFIQFLLVDFPVTLRAHAGLFWLSTLLMYVPFFTIGVICYFNPEFVYSLISESDVVMMEMMYGPGTEALGRLSGQGTDFKMFGFYIQNNIGIGFRTFAGGLLAGTFTVFSLVFNGSYFGAVAGHLTQLGYTENFWTFVSGHSSFELTAICISGAAGLRLALALFAPGRNSRIEALRLAARPAFILIMGAAAMLVAAAFVEAFWSSIRSLAPEVKYMVAGFLWVCVVLYLLLAGRSRAN